MLGVSACQVTLSLAFRNRSEKVDFSPTDHHDTDLDGTIFPVARRAAENRARRGMCRATGVDLSGDLPISGLELFLS